MENWPQNWRFCIFDHHFIQILPLFAALKAPTIHLCLRKYIFGIVLFAQPFVQSIYGVTAFQMKNWPQNWRFCIFDHNFVQILTLFAALTAPTTHLCLRKYSFGIVLCAQPFVQSIYWVTAFQIENWPQNWWFCIFDLHFDQIMALFAALRAPTTHLGLRRYIFSIVLFAQPFFQSICGFTAFQMENLSQNWRFCIFDLHFAQIWLFLQI